MSPISKVRIRRCVVASQRHFSCSEMSIKPGTEPAAQGADHYTGNGYLYTSLSQLLALKRCERVSSISRSASLKAGVNLRQRGCHTSVRATSSSEISVSGFSYGLLTLPSLPEGSCRYLLWDEKYPMPKSAIGQEPPSYKLVGPWYVELALTQL